MIFNLVLSTNNKDFIVKELPHSKIVQNIRNSRISLTINFKSFKTLNTSNT